MGITLGKHTKIKLLSASAGLACCVAAFAGYVAFANDECPAPVALNDPFSDFDDLMTEEEKRQAAHLDLEQKLALHQPSCQPSSTASATTPPESQKQSEESTSQPADSQDGGQTDAAQESAPASGVSGQDPAEESQQSEQSEQAEGQASGSQGPAGSNPAGQQAAESTPTQSTPASGVSGQGSAGGEGQSSMPSSSAAGPPSTQSGTQVESRAASGVAGAGSAAGPSGAGAAQPPSEFLKAYGAQGAQPRETVEEIASRHKNSGQGQYGSPGNTGATSSHIYGNSGVMTNQSQTVSADAGLRKSLQERLANETDPDKKKEIQAQIDDLGK